MQGHASLLAEMQQLTSHSCGEDDDKAHQLRLLVGMLISAMAASRYLRDISGKFSLSGELDATRQMQTLFLVPRASS